MPDLYIIAGCNGAGKTTASYTILPDILGCKEFVNADNIAYGISPFNVEGVALEAGRIMLHRIDELLREGADFAIETTLATRSYVSLVRRAQAIGYTVKVIYIWLESTEIALRRVSERVRKGGHNIPTDVVIRRYYKGISNLFMLFIPVCDAWILADNSEDKLNIIATGSKNLENIIENNDIWGVIKNQVYGR
ncbi:MAG: zeta toxin [Flavipsychrobacter sp.]|nr:zeta toxin [Flavipsychrobacter sp.]